MTRSPRSTRVLAVTVSLALLAAACGGDDGGSSAETTTATEETTETTAEATETTEATEETTETTAESTETTEATGGGEDAFVISTDDCPDTATTPLGEGEPIKLGFSLPQSGALASFAPLAVGMQAYFNKVNEAGGVDGHPIELVVKDDAYDPARSVTNMTEFIERDQVLASVFQVGTPNVAATRDAAGASCTPQMFVGTGFPAWGDPENYPWTTIGLMSYSTEAAVWTNYINEAYPDGATVGELVLNNDFGNAYKNALEEEVAGSNIEIVISQTHDAAAPNVNDQVAQILAANPDVVIGMTSFGTCNALPEGLRAGGYEGEIIVSATCAALLLLGANPEALNEVKIIISSKDPRDPSWDDDEDMIQYKADIAEFGAEGTDPINGNISGGYNAAALITHLLEEAAASEGGLSRASLGEAQRNVDFQTPLNIDGARHTMNAVDAYAIETGELKSFNGSTKGYDSIDVTISVEGETGVFGG
jgi:branched-chain amino acid transport system substrate-binding protein